MDKKFKTRLSPTSYELIDRLDSIVLSNERLRMLTEPLMLSREEVIESVKDLEDDLRTLIERVEQFSGIPCDIGTEVYHVSKELDLTDMQMKYVVVKTEVEKWVLRKDGVRVKLAYNKWYETSAKKFGKMIFFDKEEAEERAKELNKRKKDGK